LKNPAAEPQTDPVSLRRQALAALAEPDPSLMAQAARRLAAAASDSESADRVRTIGADECIETPADLPGRPDRPRLVDPRQVPMRSPFTAAGRAALLHAIAHIEFNAVNLALDAVWRFAALPPEYYRDWLQVAGEEALHFTLLRDHLRELGRDYGDFDAHDGLWLMAERTSGDVLARMALVPRVLEARGLDATPPLQAKFEHSGDARAAAILAVILRDEIGHVAIGNHWFGWLCRRGGHDPEATFALLAERHGAPRPRGPFNRAARLAAGFTESELARLERAAG